MKTHKSLWNILFSNQKYGVSGVFRDLRPLVLLPVLLTRHFSSFLDFQYAKIFSENLLQPKKFLNFSATLPLVSYKLVSYEKYIAVAYLKRKANWNRILNEYDGLK